MSVLERRSVHLHLLSFISVFFDTDAMTDLDIQELANLTAADGDVDNFERLFTKLKEMKGNDGNEKKKPTKNSMFLFEGLHDLMCYDIVSVSDKASSLPHEQRKVHAEKVTNCTLHNLCYFLLILIMSIKNI